jgi:hypothetical protein
LHDYGFFIISGNFALFNTFQRFYWNIQYEIKFGFISVGSFILTFNNNNPTLLLLFLALIQLKKDF